ncbi:hypothetical protein ILYODFUR_023995 [Ilyodon furcidens]|uniref:Uncharacterized protein n=1 Tax=Ilyodon furcidens TaxID=33524 RepID=A0ABV0SNS9_9TELE
MLTPLYVCIRCPVGIFIAFDNVFLVVISFLLVDFLRTDLPPCSTHPPSTHTLQSLAAPLEHKVMPLTFGVVGGSLTPCQSHSSSFKDRGISPAGHTGPLCLSSCQGQRRDCVLEI